MLVLGVLWWCVGRLRVADERRRPRGGRRPAGRSSPRWPGCWSPRCACRTRSATRRCCSRCAYAVVRVAHIALFVLASRDDPALRKSSIGPRRQHRGRRRAARRRVVRRRRGAGRAVGARAGARHGRPAAVRAGGLEARCPAHFAERHGLIVIIALGESIVAIGVGAERRRRRRHRRGRRAGHRRRRRAVVAVLRRRRARRRAPARERAAGPRAERRSRATRSPTCTSRWSPGSCSSRSGMKKTLEHVDDPLKLVPAVALLGGTALYLLAHVAFRWRNVHTLNRQRLACAALLVALVPLGRRAAVARDAGDARRCAGGARRLRDAALRGSAQPAPSEARARALAGRRAPGSLAWWL